MTARTRTLAFAVAAILAVVGVILPGTSGAAVAATSAKATKTSAAKAPTVITKHIEVKWSGSGARKTTATATVPGIGTLRIVCAPNNTIVELQATNRSAETQMWMAKYQVKNSKNTVAVKTVRIYRYANADDKGHGGTGSKAHEGLNRVSPIENYSSGYMHGIISQRPARNQHVAKAKLAPATSFELTWYWNGFHYGKAYQSCDIDVTLKTDLRTVAGVDWHGVADAAAGYSRSVAISGLGTLELTCAPSQNGAQTIAFRPKSKYQAWLYGEYIFGEGQTDYQVEVDQLTLDPLSGRVGPLDLPQNGMLRLFFTIKAPGGKTSTLNLIVSSYYIANNARHPELNVCEVAVARL